MPGMQSVSGQTFSAVRWSILEQGRGARLTALGEKLLWAEARARARLAPQLENIASELNLEIKRALAESNPTLRIHASFGYAVAEIPEMMRQDGRSGARSAVFHRD